MGPDPLIFSFVDQSRDCPLVTPREPSRVTTYGHANDHAPIFLYLHTGGSIIISDSSGRMVPLVNEATDGRSIPKLLDDRDR